MNHRITLLQPQGLRHLFQSPIDVLRVGIWSFALVNSMFLVPQIGFFWIVWNYPLGDGLAWEGGFFATAVLCGSSLLPFALLLEAWYTHKHLNTSLNTKGLVILGILTLLGTSLLGYGLPLLYALYLHPHSATTFLPYLMMASGIIVWGLVLYARRLMRTKAEV